MNLTLSASVGSLLSAILLAGAMQASAGDGSAAKLYFLVEMDHVKSGILPSRESRRAFIEQGILPTLALAEKYAAEGKILAGGPMAGRIALRFIVQADSPQEADRLVESLPLWTIAETRIIPLLTFGDRRANVELLLQRLSVDQGVKENQP